MDKNLHVLANGPLEPNNTIKTCFISRNVILYNFKLLSTCKKFKYFINTIVNDRKTLKAYFKWHFSDLIFFPLYFLDKKIV